ncbi:MAG: anti-sigma-D factor RsdA [Pseudonocardiaceae bacterium]
MSGRDDDEHGGYPPGNPFRRRHEADDPLGASNETPVDLAAVQADDALLDMLAGAEVARGDADAELAQVLVAWRRDVDTEPIGAELVDTDTAVAAIRAGRKPAARRHPVLGPVAAAAAVLVIAFSGVGLVAKSAEPGDQLFGLTKVLYSDYARSVETAQRVDTELEVIEKELAEGKTSPAQAKESLERVQQQLAVIAEAEGHTRLAAKHDLLEEKLAEMPPNPADAGSSTESKPEPQPTPSSQLPVAPVPPSPSTTSTPTEPPVQTEPTAEPSAPPTPSAGPVEPAPGTSAPTPRASPPGDATGSTPPVTPPSG